MAYDKESFLIGLAVGLTVWRPADSREVGGNSGSTQQDQTDESLEGTDDKDAV